MPHSDVVPQIMKNTVVANYISTERRSDDYESLDSLTNEFLRLLYHQGYDDRISFDDEEGMIENVRVNLEQLNDFHFTDSEWCRFYNDCIANPDEHIAEKTRKVQENCIQVFKRDDGTTKSIMLIDKDDLKKNHLEVLDHSVFMVEEGERINNCYDYSILVNGLPLVHIEVKRRDISLQEAFSHIAYYQEEATWVNCRLFEYIQLFVISNGTDTKYYSISTRTNTIKEANFSKEKIPNSFESTSYWADGNNVIIPDFLDFTRTFFATHTLLNLLTRYCYISADNELMVMSSNQIAVAEHCLNRIENSSDNNTTFNMMSNQTMIPLINEEIEKQKERTGKTETIDVIEQAIDAIAERYGTTRAAVKAKAVALGFPEAGGAFVPIDGDRTAAPYCRSDGIIDIHYTYTIDIENLRTIIDKNDELKKKVEEGLFLYVDGHLVFNSCRYCNEDNGKLLLTDFARTHIELCCIAFEIEMPSEASPLVFHEVTTLETKRIGPRVIGGITYIKGVNNGTIETQNAEFDALFSDTYKLIAECNNNLAHNLTLVLNARKVNKYDLSLELDYDEASLGRFFTGRRKPSALMLTKICIALNMPYNLSKRIFRDSPNQLDLSTKKGQLLDFALMSLYGHPIKEVGDFLKRHGVQI